MPVHPAATRSPDAGVSEVMGSILLTAVTVVLVGGFGLTVFASMSGSETPSPTGSFAIEAREGAPHVDVVYREGTSFLLDDAIFRLQRPGGELGAPVLLDPQEAGRVSPGDVLRFALPSGAVAAGEEILFFALDADTGDVIGHTRVSGGPTGSPSFATEAPRLGAVAFSPASIAADGQSVTVVSVPVSSPFGRAAVGSVLADLTAWGAGEVELRDDGRAGDAVAGDGVYSAEIRAGPGALPQGATSATLPVTIRARSAFDGAPVRHATGEFTATLTASDDAYARLAELVANSSAATNVLGVGGISRNLPASELNGEILVTNFTFRDISKVANDAIVYRVTDLTNFTRTWVVTIHFSDCAAPSHAAIGEVTMTRDGIAGDARWTPSDGCWEVDAGSVLNLADLNRSFDAFDASPRWTGTGNGSLFSYRAAGIGPINQGIVPYFGDTRPSADPHSSVNDVGLGTASVLWSLPRGPTASFATSATGLRIDADASASVDPQGFPLNYTWNWGDGSPVSHGVTASRTYATAGSYTVTLTVRSVVNETANATRVVVANRAPSAALSLMATGHATLAASSAGSSDPDGQPLTYTWLWGDGTTGTGTSPTKTYATPGLYTVRLYVNDTLGGSATATAPIGHAPLASFTSRAAGLTIATDASASSDPAGQALSYAWAWGDGTTGAGRTASRTYDSNATHVVTLTVTNTFGVAAQAQASLLHDGITWLDCPPRATAHGSMGSCDALRSATDAGATASLSETNNASRRQAFVDLGMSGFAEPGKAHSLWARARLVSGSAEALHLQVHDPTTGAWSTPSGFTWSSTTAATAGPYLLTDAQWNGGSPTFRFVDANCASSGSTCAGSDSAVTTWEIDWVRVVSS